MSVGARAAGGLRPRGGAERMMKKKNGGRKQKRKDSDKKEHKKMADNTAKSLQKVQRIRQDFSETWIWIDTFTNT